MIQLNTINKSFELPRLILQNVNSGHLESLDFKTNIKNGKKGKSSKYIVPFILKIYKMNENSLTRLIANSIINLDNLAMQIDSKIDSTKDQQYKKLSINDFSNLENEVQKCVYPLRNISEYEKLITSTLYSVNLSLKFNTYKRNDIYNFSDDINSSINCTTYYLFPLVEYLTSFSKIPVNPKRIFILIANYIQILDDFIDLFTDIYSGIETPVTNRYCNIENYKNRNLFARTSFKILANDVRRKLNDYFYAIDKEISHIGGYKHSQEILDSWLKFQSTLESIPIPLENNRFKQLDYLQNIYSNTPPMLCYT